MELPQPRPFETEGRKPTHDFLSLYNQSSVQQDPKPPSRGGYLKAHDFLQPLEVGKANAKEETSSVDMSASEKPPPPAPPPPTADQHVLPRAIGSYTISHISYFNQRVPKPEVSPMFTVAQASSNERNTDENSNCSSYAGSGFTLWEESAGKKGQTRKENVVQQSNIRAEAATKMGQWTTSERPSQSSTSNHMNSFSYPSSSQALGQKSQSFMEMIRCAKGSTQDDDLVDDEEFIIKKESSSTSQKMDLRVKVDRKRPGNDQKPNSPRSKHSATEQRRRGKINDRFQMLRELIPNTDQKRDKASFLLEVIEYIRFLQEKLNKYEGSYQGWNHEPGKLMNWRNCQRPAANYMEQSRGIDGGAASSVVCTPKFDERNIPISQTLVAKAQSRVDQLDMVNKATMPFTVSLQPNLFSPGGSGTTVSQVSTRVVSEASEANATCRTQAQSCGNRWHSADVPVGSDKLKEEEVGVEGGTISISSVYSQGLLKTLTQALQSSGVDMSQASISVQIELGKRHKDETTSSPSIIKDNEGPSGNQRPTRIRVENGDDLDQNPKKLKTGQRLS